MQMDHHCPWMNNCIGLYNQKAFVLFNFYAAVTCAWTMSMVCSYAFPCVEDELCTVFDVVPILGLCTGVTVIMCGLMALFSAVMFCDQVKMIQENTGTIDKMQAKRSSNMRVKTADTPIGASPVLYTKNTCKMKAIKVLCIWLPINVHTDISIENQLFQDY